MLVNEGHCAHLIKRSSTHLSYKFLESPPPYILQYRCKTKICDCYWPFRDRYNWSLGHILDKYYFCFRFSLIILTLYNLKHRSDGMSRLGYFHWKLHICNFIERHWNILLGNSVWVHYGTWDFQRFSLHLFSSSCEGWAWDESPASCPCLYLVWPMQHVLSLPTVVSIWVQFCGHFR
jgi:hypothetical protein